MREKNGGDERLLKSWFHEVIQHRDGVIASPTSEAEVMDILTRPNLYPSPIRPVGSRHSMTPCISARATGGSPERWGTLVDMTGFISLCDESGKRTNESLRIDWSASPVTVTVPAGRTFYDVAHELRRVERGDVRGLQFRVNTELGSLTMGAAACGATKDSSFPGEFGQVCHDAVGMRLITPGGERRNLKEGDRDFDALRCSYGLFGIVTEVTYRVYPLEYISLKHEKVKPEDGEAFTPPELKKHFHAWLNKDEAGNDRNAVFLYLFPYRDRIVAEVRTKPATGGETHDESVRLEIRNRFWGKGAHSWEKFARRVVPSEVRRGLQDLFDKALAEYLAHVLRLDKVNPVAQVVNFDKQDEEHRFTFSMWAFPEDKFPEILPQYFDFCEKHEANFRTGLPHVSYHIAKDESSLLSYSREGPVWTLDPIAPENAEGWEPFLREFNEFCSMNGGVPLLNQTPHLTREQVRRAFGTRLTEFEAARRRFDPGDRMLNAYFADLLSRSQESAPGRKHQNVTRMVTDHGGRASYDYIVVGSGAGGAPAAARLAEHGFSVLVLEQGLDRPSRYVDVPLLLASATEDPDTSTCYRVRHFSDPGLAARDWKWQHEGGKGLIYPRGTGRIGGSTQINVQVWVRADDDDWNRYADATGDDFWRARNMRRLLQLVERCEYRPILKLLNWLGRCFGIAFLRNRRGHGFNGYIETTRGRLGLLARDCKLLWITLKTFIYSLRLGGTGDQVRRLLAFYDPNDDRVQGTEGPVYTPVTITRRGRRAGGVRDRLLDVRAKHPANLEIRTGATVRNIALDEHGMAVGVRYADPDGREHVVPVGREVIVAAGAFETPAILMRSGIGSKDALDKLGIKPVVHLPGVGQSLHDRYEIGVISQMKRDFALLRGVRFEADPGDPEFGKWIATGRGVYGSNGVVFGFQKKTDRALPTPDLYIFCLPATIQGYYTGYSRKTVEAPNRLTWMVLYENKGDKKGTVLLNKDNINGQPAINFRYHSEDDPEHPDDSRPVVAGVKAAREATARFARLVDHEYWPGAAVQSDEALREAIESNSWGHHANGTARMGRRGETMAVVDADLKVIGTRNVRVSDASVFPHTPGSFIVSAVVQIGEAAAIKAIAEARGQDPLAVMDTIMRQA